MGKKILSGVNDLYTWCLEQGEYGRIFLQEWTGLTEDGDILNIHELAPMSTKRVLFKCTKNREHEWYAKISARNACLSGCPHCSKKIRKKSKSLYDWCMEQGDFGDKIIRGWVGKDCDNNDINIHEVSFGSAIRARLKCENKHEWDVKIASLTYNKVWCPHCNIEKRKTVKDYNKSLHAWCLENREIGSKILREWTGIDEDGKVLDINKVAKYSNIKVLWRCSNNHTWYALISSRTSMKSGCPYCSSKIASIDNNLLTWCNQNGAYGKLILSEWVGEDVSSNKVDITKILPGTGLEVKWRCSNGHEWSTAVHNRTNINRPRGCPHCAKQSTSYIEQLLYIIIKQKYSRAINRYIGFKDVISRELEYDIYIPEIEVFIEYSPSYTHWDKIDRDKLKIETVLDANKHIIFINDDTVISMNKTNNIINVKYNNEIELAGIICRLLSINDTNININVIKQEAFDRSHGKLEIENRVFEVYPNLKNELHSILNKIDIEKISIKSNLRIYWVCNKCGYGENGEWESAVSTRTSGKSGCPRCGYNSFKDDYNYRALIPGKNDLASVYPELSKEWHPNNKVKPTEVHSKSGAYVNWLCTKCGYGTDGKWKSSIVNRVMGKSGCPRCFYNWYKAMNRKEQTYRKGVKMLGKYNL